MTIEEKQKIGYEMRRKFIHIMTDVSSEECSVQFSCKEKSSATAKLQTFNPRFETFGVFNLKTPMATYETALLRSADVSFIEFRYAES